MLSLEQLRVKCLKRNIFLDRNFLNKILADFPNFLVQHLLTKIQDFKWPTFCEDEYATVYCKINSNATFNLDNYNWSV